MEGVSTKVYKGVKGYWRRRGYQRISGSGRKRIIPAVCLGSGGSTRKTRFWNVKIHRKIKLKCLFASPKKFLVGIRDAYVRMMMRLASSGAVGVTGYGHGYGGEACFVTRPVKEYDEKMVVELYNKILMGRNQLVHPDGSEMVIRR
ncbi:Glycosyl transferase family protein [Heracleum sosnowskyi]|uniref:Glycosyl transferase family protein n=1 Tax=Heracleum sosnowskyi TaxID=360622 RepID=A0AAD8M177_9APIA|nr:Glycosyl transferase family protein [Heracleum sosnowskyi]